MKTSYAVRWREPNGHIFLGKLEFAPQALVLEGRNGGEAAVRRTIDFDELRGCRLGRTVEERLDGRPTLVVERAGGDVLVTSAAMHAGVLHELLHRLAELRQLAPRRATVVVPLKKGAVEQARQLATRGPPFDPVDTMLVRHQLLLTPNEAIFVFEADSELALEALLGQVDHWAEAAAWRDVVAGAPRLAEIVYAWERPAELSGVGLGF